MPNDLPFWTTTTTTTGLKGNAHWGYENLPRSFELTDCQSTSWSWSWSWSSWSHLFAGSIDTSQFTNFFKPHTTAPQSSQGCKIVLRRANLPIVEAILFIGIQATGKTTFYRERFADNHIPLSMDMLRTRHREGILLRALIDAKQPFVVDNTNATASERRRYISAAKEAGFSIIGYYFASAVQDALVRNAARDPKKIVPERGVLGTYKKLERPQKEEGFAKLYYVALQASGGFVVEEWRSDEV